MVDIAKRNTLKTVAGIGVGAVAVASSTDALAKIQSMPNALSSTRSLLPQADIADLADIKVITRVSPQTNELEVVLTNVGTSSANITDMTPAEINTARGRFDFDALFENGDVHLEVGSSISVPMQHHTVVLDASSVGKRSVVLSEALRQNVSIITDGDSLAAVEFVNATVAA